MQWDEEAVEQQIRERLSTRWAEAQLYAEHLLDAVRQRPAAPLPNEPEPSPASTSPVPARSEVAQG
jgi:hypothetical protein